MTTSTDLNGAYWREMSSTELCVHGARAMKCRACKALKQGDACNVDICNSRVKENAVAEFLRTAFPHRKFTFNKRVKGGSSRRRPDVIIHLGNQTLIIEIDENRHKNYCPKDDAKRLDEIQRDLKGRKLIVLRFNPDGYINKKGKHISSPFRTNSRGQTVLRKSKRGHWERRLAKLHARIDFWCVTRLVESRVVEYICFGQDRV